MLLVNRAQIPTTRYTYGAIFQAEEGFVVFGSCGGVYFYLDQYIQPVGTSEMIYENSLLTPYQETHAQSGEGLMIDPEIGGEDCEDYAISYRIQMFTKKYLSSNLPKPGNSNPTPLILNDNRRLYYSETFKRFEVQTVLEDGMTRVQACVEEDLYMSHQIIVVDNN